MNERQAVAVRDDAGQWWWFLVAEATRWHATTLQGGELFRIAGRWAVLDSTAAMCCDPARVIDDQEALSWFLSSGHAPPAELADYAVRCKLR